MKTEDVVSRAHVRSSEGWSRSIGKRTRYSHYREKDGRQHAECTDGICKIHTDRHNPHHGAREAVRHLARDAPKVGQGLCAVAGAACLAGAALYRRKRL
ncbi:MAG: hypothetical protein ACOCT0_02110 [Halobacteriota archaeon]